VPVKITGEFIIKGMSSQFQAAENEEGIGGLTGAINYINNRGYSNSSGNPVDPNNYMDNVNYINRPSYGSPPKVGSNVS